MSQPINKCQNCDKNTSKNEMINSRNRFGCVCCASCLSTAHIVTLGDGRRCLAFPVTEPVPEGVTVDVLDVPSLAAVVKAE
jgi:CO dehydrogenase/acetyl-CoA synthase delta subunit